MPRKTSAFWLAARAATTASMRPRPDAAENGAAGLFYREAFCRFNEAAARCRGKHGAAMNALGPPTFASMRPRPDAAENKRRVAPAGVEPALQ